MSRPIDDYAVISDMRTAALVSRDGSINWLCLPRFDSAACFAALLGDESNGHWTVAPAGAIRRSRRRYAGDTLVLENEFETAEGAVQLIDFMPRTDAHSSIVRIVEGLRGRVPMRMELAIRFDYGRDMPWVHRVHGGVVALAGPDALFLKTPVATRGEGLTTVAEFTVAPGEEVSFVLGWHPSQELPRTPPDPVSALADTKAFWRALLTRKALAST
jgi:GH15 family glucan-1,4-alpha-glucosidase